MCGKMNNQRKSRPGDERILKDTINHIRSEEFCQFTRPHASQDTFNDKGGLKEED